jgi:hypothetical protein
MGTQIFQLFDVANLKFYRPVPLFALSGVNWELNFTVTLGKFGFRSFVS